MSRFSLIIVNDNIELQLVAHHERELVTPNGIQGPATDRRHLGGATSINRHRHIGQRLVERGPAKQFGFDDGHRNEGHIPDTDTSGGTRQPISMPQSPPTGERVCPRAHDVVTIPPEWRYRVALVGVNVKHHPELLDQLCRSNFRWFGFYPNVPVLRLFRQTPAPRCSAMAANVKKRFFSLSPGATHFPRNKFGRRTPAAGILLP